MPWCDDCAKFWNPNSLPADGSCPSCGRAIAEPRPEDGDEELKAPWHFKLMVVLLAIYLTWRFLQLLGVIPDQ